MIIDSSTLILLAKSELLDVFIDSSKKKILVTGRIKIESTAKKGSFDAGLIEQRIKEKKILVEKIKDTSFYNKLLEDFNLGQGEAEAIVLALEKNALLLSDDKKAINACKIFNIKFATALNVLVELYKRKIMGKERAKLALKKLKQIGRYSEELINKAEDDLK